MMIFSHHCCDLSRDLQNILVYFPEDEFEVEPLPRNISALKNAIKIEKQPELDYLAADLRETLVSKDRGPRLGARRKIIGR